MELSVQVEALPAGGWVSRAPGPLTIEVQVSVEAVNALFDMASSSIVIGSVRLALRLLSVSFSTAAVMVEGLLTVKRMALAYVLVWVALLEPTHMVVRVP